MLVIKTSSFILICVYIVKTLCKDVISISIDNDKLKNKNKKNDIKIEIKNARNKSRGNVISISSGSLEHYETTEYLRVMPKCNSKYHKYKSKNYRKAGTQIKQHNANLMYNKNLRTEQQNDRRSQGNLMNILGSFTDSKKLEAKPENDKICYNKIDDTYENEEIERGDPSHEEINESAEKTIESLKQNNFSKLIGKEMLKTDPESIHNGLARKIMSFPKETRNRWAETHQENMNRERAEPHSRCDTENMRAMTKAGEKENEDHSEKDHSSQENISSENTGSIPTGGDSNYSMKTSRSFSDVETRRAEPESENTYYEEIDNSNENETRQREKMPCEEINESTEKVIVPRNSSIEVSDYEYQGIKAIKENSDENEQNTINDYPYSVSIQRKGSHYATGALVGERWVLSTAEEFYNVRETIRFFRMRLGSVNCKKGGIVTPIKSITVHFNFTPGKPHFDISILKMAEPVPLSPVVTPIGISRVDGQVVSAKFLTTYWPRIVTKQGVLPQNAKERIKYNSMRVSTQKLVPSEECHKQMATVNVTLDNSSLCLKPVKIYHSDCMPDVGAPVISVDGLWGITSGWVSPLCPAKPLPTVITRVSSKALQTWIDAQMHL